MELYQLKYFLYAAKYENISKAAQALRVSQPSISRAVVALEKELQVELFERQGKRIILTRAGLTFREQISPHFVEAGGAGG
ncbi:LysR family transcriptional regulator [Alitiscatomonas sp.]|uniref:LysR family transcriptional regulator n=1 Tax=Alitiscatomonas sp. TaxID=2981647 RepID=UPI003077C369